MLLLASSVAATPKKHVIAILADGKRGRSLHVIRLPLGPGFIKSRRGTDTWR